MALVIRTVGVVILAGMVLFFIKLYQKRSWFRQQMKNHNVVSALVNIQTLKEGPNWYLLTLAADIATLVSFWPSHSDGQSRRCVSARLVSCLLGTGSW